MFVPTAFMAGISGQFYKQFALTIAASTVISAFNSLTLSPALCALLLKPHGHGQAEGHGGRAVREVLPPLGIAVIGGLMAYVFLSGFAAQLAGIESHAEGHGCGRADSGSASGLFAVGAVAGWFVSKPVNSLLGKFFDGFNWVFDVAIKGYGASSACCCGRASSG